MPRPSRPWLDHSNYTWRKLQVMKFLVERIKLLLFKTVHWIWSILLSSKVLLVLTIACCKND
jgi:hypothetical protein